MQDQGKKFSQFACPSCGHPVTKVSVTNGPRRSRQCVKCKARFTTYELIEPEYRVFLSIKKLLGDRVTKIRPAQRTVVWRL